MKSARILIVEDEPDTADSLAELLGMWGYESIVARNGRAALALAEAERPDVILLDLGLPIVDGWQVAAELRAAALPKSPFVIAVSGYTEMGPETGIDMHMVKPIDLGVLELVLERFEVVTRN